MPTKSPTIPFLILLSLFCAGCVRFSTPGERKATFAPYKETKVGQESLSNYLLGRSAALFTAYPVGLSPTNSDLLRITGTNFNFGTAAAIDRRGYFLTAAHCVGESPSWIVLLKEDKIQVEPARVVWRGNVKKKEPDLALLSVASPLKQTFEWAKEYTNGIPISDLGLNFNYEARDLGMQCMAGKVLKISNPAKRITPQYTIISHNSPLHRGDSGGPLVLPDGRLLGINISVQTGFQWKHFRIEPLHSNAHRPDLAWLQELINNDADLRAKAP